MSFRMLPISFCKVQKVRSYVDSISEKYHRGKQAGGQAGWLAGKQASSLVGR